jgi:hypothetical protein
MSEFNKNEFDPKAAAEARKAELEEITKKLEKGVKDEVIAGIENMYNKSNTKIFNIQFTSESDFLNWAKLRMTLFPDESTIELLKEYERE